MVGIILVIQHLPGLICPVCLSKIYFPKLVDFFQWLLFCFNTFPLNLFMGKRTQLFEWVCGALLYLKSRIQLLLANQRNLICSCMAFSGPISYFKLISATHGVKLHRKIDLSILSIVSENLHRTFHHDIQ